VEDMASPQQNQWNGAMKDESTSILLNNTFSALNSREAKQPQVKLNALKCTDMTKCNSDWTSRYKVWLVEKRYQQTDFGETNAPVGKLPMFQYFISLIGR